MSVLTELVRAVLVALRNILEEGGIAGAIAVGLTVTVCVLAVRQAPIPDLLSNALTTILGFYFGSAVTRERNAANKRGPEIDENRSPGSSLADIQRR